MKNLYSVCLLCFLMFAAKAQSFTPEALQKLNLEVKPNARYDQLNIKCTENIEFAEVSDMYGHRIQSAEGSISRLDIFLLPDGIYLLKLKTFTGVSLATRFVKD